MCRLVAILLFLTASTAGAAAPVLSSPGDALRVAASYAGALPEGRRRGALFVSLHALPPDTRPDAVRVLAFAVNSLSARQPLFCAPIPVGGLVAYVDIDFLGVRRADLDRLGLLGSGPAPFPEPYFHSVTEDDHEAEYRTEDVYEYRPYGYWRYDGYGTRVWVRGLPRREKTGTRRVLVRPAGRGHKVSPYRRDLPVDAVIALCKLTGSEFAIFEYHWFLSYALTEPRYHELVGAGESLASFERLVGLDARLLARLRATSLRGVVLFSEVAERNRALERAPLPGQYGRNSYWTSLDYKTSLGPQDLLDDLLQQKSDARELIASAANGLSLYLVVDGAGKRLDSADPNVALDSRTRLKRKVIDVGFHCMGCHTPEGGFITVDDTVRRMSRAPVALAVDRDKKAGKVSRAEIIQDRYLTVDVNELVADDQGFYSRRVIACCGLPPAKVSRILQTAIWRYLDGPVTLASVSPEVGYPPAVVRDAIRYASAARALHNEPFDSHLVGMALGRPQRRDQVEAAFDLLAEAVYDYTHGEH